MKASKMQIMTFFGKKGPDRGQSGPQGGGCGTKLTLMFIK